MSGIDPWLPELGIDIKFVVALFTLTAAIAVIVFGLWLLGVQ